LIGGWRFDFILQRWSRTRALKLAFQTARCGGLLSKMTSFLCFQIHQAPIISRAKKSY
jgi:hypothetical protein